MYTFTLVSLFILGTILGSGLNALAYRLHIQKPWIRARSQCPKCGHGLAWWELIPLVSFMLLRRRCGSCGKKISWQYPLVELSAGGLLALSFVTFGATVGTLLASVASLLLLFIYIYDGRTMTIPNPAVWSFNILAFVSLFLNLSYPLFSSGGRLLITPGWLELLAGPLLALPFFLLWLGSHGRAIGFADVKLALGLGWMLGIAGGFSAVILAFWIGAGVSLALLTYQRLWKSLSPKQKEGHTMKSAESNTDGGTDRELTMKSAVPFGPFLILGWIIVFFSNLTLF